MEAGCEARRRGRGRGSSNRGSNGGGARCSREELQKDLRMERHHRRRCNCKQRRDMGGGGLTVSHPASAKIAWLGWLSTGTQAGAAEAAAGRQLT